MDSARLHTLPLLSTEINWFVSHSNIVCKTEQNNIVCAEEKQQQKWELVL